MARSQTEHDIDEIQVVQEKLQTPHIGLAGVCSNNIGGAQRQDLSTCNVRLGGLLQLKQFVDSPPEQVKHEKWQG